ncbi:hypothetical protein Nocox_01005 [Nonomuraea coxensis DSM 45129]|uniref:Uncharacterized protein n=1 Tax=Nonomuraea coxensis DSM 45129 TaxID=1122611 RepID=A0ABX8TQS1_9ACTN|nr:hypothetical protein [Nonomuraea coxensis]QYC37835.1 hypothetical protein Nocox_01005 [Nonomuraea coxensis DSM 45129]
MSDGRRDSSPHRDGPAGAALAGPPGAVSGPAGGDGQAAARVSGALLALGAVAWAVGTVVVGEKIQEGVQTLDTITGMMFVVGVWAFVRHVLADRASGVRAGRFIPMVLLVTLLGAFLLNALSFGYATHDDFPLWLMIMDAFWPLSMFGMLVLGVAIAVTARYQGMMRWLPLAAGLWFPVTMAAQILAGGTASTLVSAAWLTGTYAVIGVRLMRG